MPSWLGYAPLRRSSESIFFERRRMSQMGQTTKYSPRVNVFRFATNIARQTASRLPG